MRNIEQGRGEIQRLFNEAIETGVDKALQQLKEKFENAPEPENRLAYHNRIHTREVMDRTVQILRAIQQTDTALVSERDIEFGKLIASHHDTVQNWEKKTVAETGGFKVVRQRFIKDNEAKSAEGLIAFIAEVNRTGSQDPVFTEADELTATEAIMATVPDFDPEHKTVVQPNLHQDSLVVTRALALADLGGAGMGGPEKFLAEGDAYFREENLDILEALENPSAITKEQKEYFKQRMVAWSNFQSSFAHGRQTMLIAELAGLYEPAQTEVKKLFPHFNASIESAKLVGAKRTGMTFEQLLKDMGY